MAMHNGQDQAATDATSKIDDLVTPQEEQEQIRLEIASNIKEVRENIRAQACSAGRDPSEIKLIAVSKAQPINRIVAALQQGTLSFGENYVQESQGRWPDLRNRFSNLTIHMIGPIQSNKAGIAVSIFDLIQTIDRPKLARALSREMEKQQKAVPVLIQVNTGEEPQKSGVLPNDLPSLIELCKDELQMDVRGLMAIPPADQDTAFHTALLRKLTERHGLTETSIGMSGDYMTAVRFGATIVRVGTGIFGKRTQKR